MNHSLSKVQIVDDAEITDAQRVAPALLTFQRLASVGLLHQRINCPENSWKDRVMLLSELLEIVGRALIDNNTPTT